MSYVSLSHKLTFKPLSIFNLVSIDLNSFSMLMTVFELSKVVGSIELNDSPISIPVSILELSFVNTSILAVPPTYAMFFVLIVDLAEIFLLYIQVLIGFVPYFAIDVDLHLARNYVVFDF